jgi:hypothetical protein
MVYSLNSGLGVDLASTYTATQFANGEAGAILGQRALGSDGNTYVFVLAAEAITQYAACRLLENGTVDMLTTTNSGAVPTTVVVPQVAIADASYGWAVEKGVLFSVLAKTLCAADVKVYTHATAGHVDDTATDLIQGLRLNETVGGADAAATASAVNGMSTNDA